MLFILIVITLFLLFLLYLYIISPADHRSFEGTPLWQSLLIASIMTNAVARPHFIAYNHEDARQRLSLRLFHLLGGKLAGWTVRDTDNSEECRNRFDVIIFEFFRP